MPTIKPVSDLRNYGEILREVVFGRPVFLTKNGHGKYVVLDIEEYQEFERLRAISRLMSEIEKGRRSGEEEGWIPAEEVFRELEEKYDE